MQNIVNACPPEILFREKMREAGGCLVKIYQTKADVERTYQPYVPDHDQHQPDQSKKNVKNIVRECAAREAFVCRNNKTQNADEN